jgi:hypothetical protein
MAESNEKRSLGQEGKTYVAFFVPAGIYRTSPQTGLFLFVSFVNSLCSLWFTSPQRTQRVRKGRKVFSRNLTMAALFRGRVGERKKTMDRTLFVRLARPGSGAIFNPRASGCTLCLNFPGNTVPGASFALP